MASILGNRYDSSSEEEPSPTAIKPGTTPVIPAPDVALEVWSLAIVKSL